MSIEDVVRASLHDLADRARPADLTQAAIARGRRLRRRRLAKITAAGLAVAVAGALGPSLAPGGAEVVGHTTLYYSDGTTVLAELGPSVEEGEATQPVPADLRRPTGLVVNQVLSELAGTPGSALQGRTWNEIRAGGYRIVTTVDARAQAELERVADPSHAGSALAGQPANLRAAAVLVEPGTGRVRAYFGGSDGAGPDFAGVYPGEAGELVGFGAHPPGGTFQVHTLASALQAGYSLNSEWYSMPHDMPGRIGENRVRNSAVCPTGGSACSLADSSVVGLETTFYAVTVSVTPARVLETARAAGIQAMWDDAAERHRLTGRDLNALVPSRFGFELGIGQYPVTVLDQANAMATYAAGGRPAQAHFVASVFRGDEQIYGETLPTAGQPRIMDEGAIADLTWALSQSPAGRIDGHDSASKTGDWEYGTGVDNAHAWTAGYTTGLAMAVWVGDRAGGPIRLADGSAIVGAGLPATIYRDVMTAAHSTMGLRTSPFARPVFGGDVNPRGSGVP